MSFDPEQLHVIRCYERRPPLAGGMELHIAALTAAQRNLGVRVTELFNRGSASGEAVQVWPGREIDHVRPYLLRSALFYGAASRRMFGFSADEFLVVHVHGDWPAFLFGWMFARRLGADAIAASLHSTAHASLKTYRWALRGYNPIFTTGAKQSEQLSTVLDRAVVHMPSAPADFFFEQFKLQPRRIDVVAVGSLVPVKNTNLLLDCAARLPHRSFAIAGGGPEEPALRRRIVKMGLRNVQILGHISAEEVRKLYHRSGLFVNTSATEGSPTAALEAMACGLPVVLTPSNDYSDLLAGGAVGRVTSGWHVDELARVIDELLDDELGLKRARAAARKLAHRHRWDLNARLVTDAMIAAVERKTALV